jgi:hypothetical protein
MKKDIDGNRGTHSFADGLSLSSNAILSGNGDIVGNVSGAAGAVVDVGASAGLINVSGNWNNTGLDIDLELDDLSASLVPGVEYDQLAITGLFTHGGTVTIDLSEYVGPATPQQLKLIGWGSEAGLNSSTMVSFVGGSPLSYVFQSDGLYVTADMVAILVGDYNDNGIVDAADFTVWRDKLGTTNVLPNDPLGGTIGPAQYDQWRDNFGAVLGSGSGSLAHSPVPEPSAWVLWMGFAILVQVVWHRVARSAGSR